MPGEARLLLDWAMPLRRATVYKAVYRPAVLRANRMTPNGAAARAQVSRPPAYVPEPLYRGGTTRAGGRAIVGHAKPSTTEVVYPHLFNTDDHAGAMTRSGLWRSAPIYPENVVPLRS